MGNPVLDGGAPFGVWMDIVTGKADGTQMFMEGKYQTAAELDLFTKLDQNSISAKDLAAMLDLNERATTRILDCLITFELLEKQNNCYRTTEQGSYLSSLHPHSLLPMVKHSIRLWNNWNHLTVAIKEGTNPHLQPLSNKTVSDEEGKAFMGSMHIGARILSSKISDAYDSRPFNRLLDIGGGSGAYTIAGHHL